MSVREDDVLIVRRELLIGFLKVKNVGILNRILHNGNAIALDLLALLGLLFFGQLVEVLVPRICLIGIEILQQPVNDLALLLHIIGLLHRVHGSCTQLIAGVLVQLRLIQPSNNAQRCYYEMNRGSIFHMPGFFLLEDMRDDTLVARSSNKFRPNDQRLLIQQMQDDLGTAIDVVR